MVCAKKDVSGNVSSSFLKQVCNCIRLTGKMM